MLFRSQPGGPVGGLYQDRAGALFGSTEYGGGAVFRLYPPATGGGPWAETTLHTFPFRQKPSAGLIHDATAAAFFGVTAGSFGGTVFALQPPAAAKSGWTETVLHRFGRTGDGRYPQARLSRDKGGNLYGTTAGGGAHLIGTVFKISP